MSVRLGLPALTTGERILAAIFLVTLPLVNPYVRGEGNGYYAYVPSLVLDRDLDFDNEFRRGDPDFVSSTFRRADGHPWPAMFTATGRLRNQWSLGPALLWTPAFVEAHSAVVALDALGARIPADGYSRPYRWACAVATASYAFLGLLLAHRVAARFTSPMPALAATLAVWFATSLPVYMYFLPFQSHALSAFSVSAFVWYWIEARPLASWAAWSAWGALGGLMFDVDPLNGVFLLVAPIEWTRAVRAEGAPVAWAVRATAFLGSGLLVALPQLAVRQVLHASPFETGRLARWFWNRPRLWDVGLGAEHGLFLWTPVVLGALLGLLWLCRRDRLVAGALLAEFAIFYYLVAGYDRSFDLSGFGNRFFISFTPVFVLGLAVLLHEARSLAPDPARRWAVLGLCLALLVAWNAGLMFQWGSGLLDRRGAVDFREVVRNQVSVVPRRIAAFGLRYLKARDKVVREQEQGQSQ